MLKKLSAGISSGLRKAGERIASLKRDHPAARILLNKYFIATVIFVANICYFDTNTIGVLLRTESTLEEQEKQIEDLNREISASAVRIEQLNSQKDTLEKFAREEYLFHEEGEDVFVVSHN